jgi:hypothetical protein
MTDHRTEAETALGEAAKIVDSENTSHSDDMFGWALIGIGHALLALNNQATIKIQAPNYVSDIRCGYRFSSGDRCVLLKPHTGIPHRIEARAENPEQSA